MSHFPVVVLTKSSDDRYEHAEAEQREEKARRSAAARKAVATKLKKRIAEGKCPACKDTFPDVAGHIAEAHPGYGEREE